MPKRTDIKTILVIGSGPIIIGQACEFDYSGTQAIKALRQEGYRVVLVNSNPATIMTDPEEAFDLVSSIGYPTIVRASFTLGGKGAGIAYNIEEFRRIVVAGLRASPVGAVQVEESVLGWKEYELEVMRDRADNFVVVCSIENLDAMGVHTGDSITVAPAITLSDREYQRMRDWARKVISIVGVETGGSNIQFAVNPEDGRMVVIEMNPRVSRSSALASKATGFPIAKIAAKLAVGYTLDEIPNDITRETPASFEPTIVPWKRASQVGESQRRGGGNRRIRMLPLLRRLSQQQTLSLRPFGNVCAGQGGIDSTIYGKDSPLVCKPARWPF